MGGLILPMLKERCRGGDFDEAGRGGKTTHCRLPALTQRGAQGARVRPRDARPFSTAEAGDMGWVFIAVTRVPAKR